MKKIFFAGLALTILVSCTQKPMDKGADYERKADSVLAMMTLDEKVGQMTQISVNKMLAGEARYAPARPFALNSDSLYDVVVDHMVGSVFGGAREPFTREEWRRFTAEIEAAAENTRLKIPVLYGVDAIHGMSFLSDACLFSNQLGQAATFNVDLVHDAAVMAAEETRDCKIPWNFSPVLGVARQPLWSRFSETYGEDTYLCGIMGEASITGYEGDDVAEAGHVAACMKHFVGYSVPMSGKDRTAAWLPERMLKEYFLPPFVRAVKKGVHTVMINSGEVNGVPVHASYHLLTGVLRHELGFKGVAVTDFKDIILLNQSHRVAADYKEAVKLAINAGIDMSMVPFDFDFQRYLKELVEEGAVPVKRIDEAVGRILRLKFELGLFDKAVVAAKESAVDKEKNRALCRDMALESITLLKNDGVLPVKKDQKILVTGATANSMIFLNGPWSYSWQGADRTLDRPEKHTVVEALQAMSPKKVSYVEGCTLDSVTSLARAQRMAQQVDVIVACVGELPGVEEIGNTNSLVLSEAQRTLVDAMTATGKPVVLVLNTGRPRIITQQAAGSSAVVMAYYPGDEGGDALAALLYGEENFSGRLPFTWPQYSASIPTTYDYKNTDLNIDNDTRGYNPLYPFGYGLSYTTFTCTALTLDKQEYTPQDTIRVRVEVRNSGDVAGKVVIPLFVRDLYASVTPPARRLRRFKKILLKPGEQQTVEFSLPVEELAFVGVNNAWQVEPGEFEVFALDRKVGLRVIIR